MILAGIVWVLFWQATATADCSDADKRDFLAFELKEKIS